MMRRAWQCLAGILSGILGGLFYYFVTAFIYENRVFFGFELKTTAFVLFLIFTVIPCAVFLVVRKRASAFAACHLCASVITGAAFLMYILTIRFYY